MQNVNVKKLTADAIIPHRAHTTDAGADLFAAEDTIIKANSSTKVSTGIAIELETGFAGLVWGKSSIESKGIKIMAGLIDADYRGEVLVCMYNLTNQDFTFKKGDKIAQLVITNVEYPTFSESEKINNTKRGEGGFGSTGHR